MNGHSSVDALIALTFYDERNDITETVLWHMEPHKVISAKVAKREKLCQAVMELLLEFTVIDSESRTHLDL